MCDSVDFFELLFNYLKNPHSTHLLPSHQSPLYISLPSSGHWLRSSCGSTATTTTITAAISITTITTTITTAVLAGIYD